MAEATECQNFGIDFFGKRNLLDAIFWFQKAVEKNNELSESFIYLGRCYAIQLSLDQAIHNFEQACQVSQNEERAKYWLELAHQRGYMIDEYPDLFRKIYWMERDDEDGHIEHCKELYAAGFLSEAYEGIKHVISIRPGDAFLWLFLGHLCEESKRSSEAITAFRKAIEIDEDYADAWFNLGIISSEIFDMSGAAECFEKVIDLDPENYKAWNNLGYAYFRLFNFDKAISAFSEAVKINPSMYQAWYRLAGVYVGKRL